MLLLMKYTRFGQRTVFLARIEEQIMIPDMLVK